MSYPYDHSKLSSSDQAKYPSTGTPAAAAAATASMCCSRYAVRSVSSITPPGVGSSGQADPLSVTVIRAGRYRSVTQTSSRSRPDGYISQPIAVWREPGTGICRAYGAGPSGSSTMSCRK